MFQTRPNHRKCLFTGHRGLTDLFGLYLDIFFFLRIKLLKEEINKNVLPIIRMYLFDTHPFTYHLDPPFSLLWPSLASPLEVVIDASKFIKVGMHRTNLRRKVPMQQQQQPDRGILLITRSATLIFQTQLIWRGNKQEVEELVCKRVLTKKTLSGLVCVTALTS